MSIAAMAKLVFFNTKARVETRGENVIIVNQMFLIISLALIKLSLHETNLAVYLPHGVAFYNLLALCLKELLNTLTFHSNYNCLRMYVCTYVIHNMYSMYVCMRMCPFKVSSIAVWSQSKCEQCMGTTCGNKTWE